MPGAVPRNPFRGSVEEPGPSVALCSNQVDPAVASAILRVPDSSR